jgi:hypothetical protein
MVSCVSYSPSTTLTPDVLKFEFLSQLLYDSNYHILTARLLAMDTPVLSIPHTNEIPSLGYFIFYSTNQSLLVPLSR